MATERHVRYPDLEVPRDSEGPFLLRNKWWLLSDQALSQMTIENGHLRVVETQDPLEKVFTLTTTIKL